MRIGIKKSGRVVASIGLFMLLFSISYTGVYATPPSEYEVKVAFIHNIAKFVEWPVAARSRGKLRLCILGVSPFNQATGSLVGKQIGGLAWEVQLIDSRTSLTECRVLFIAASEASNLRRVLEDIKGSAILTVGDSDGYAEQGVMLNFYRDKNNVRFEFHEDAIRHSGLQISSQLLKLGRIVKERGEGK